MKWRRFNIGANTPSDDGLYFSWGNAQGHVKGSGYDFSDLEYSQTPGASISEDLTLENDMSHINLGGKARTPSVSDFEELLNNTSQVWTTLNGVTGCLFTSNINSEVLFIPASGFYNGTTLTSFGTSGHCYSSIYKSSSNVANLWIKKNDYEPNQIISRAFGCSVRPVWDPNL